MGQAAELDAVIVRMTADFYRAEEARLECFAAHGRHRWGFVPVMDHFDDPNHGHRSPWRNSLPSATRIRRNDLHDDWYAKGFRKAGYPALFVDQAYPDARG